MEFIMQNPDVNTMVTKCFFNDYEKKHKKLLTFSIRFIVRVINWTLVDHS